MVKDGVDPLSMAILKEMQNTFIAQQQVNKDLQIQIIDLKVKIASLQLAIQNAGLL